MTDIQLGDVVRGSIWQRTVPNSPMILGKVVRTTGTYAFVEWIEPEGRCRTYAWWHYGRFVSYDNYRHKNKMKKTSLMLVERKSGPW